MPRSQKPRKKYRPKTSPAVAVVNPVQYVLDSFKTLSIDTLKMLAIQNHGALNILATGQGSEIEWTKLAYAVNITIELAHMGYGPEALEPARAARDALIACSQRYDKRGQFGFTGPEITAVKEALAYHDAQLEVVRLGDLEKVHAKIKNLMRSSARTISEANAGERPEGEIK